VPVKARDRMPTVIVSRATTSVSNDLPVRHNLQLQQETQMFFALLAVASWTGDSFDIPVVATCKM
jgi:hypothetical protein